MAEPGINSTPHAKLAEIGLKSSRWTAGFWAGRAAMCRDSLVPAMGRLMHDSQRIRFVGNFEVAVGRVEGKHRGPKWNDGDFYKWLEAAAATLAGGENSMLEKIINDAIALIAAAQDADGYIHTDVQIRQRAGELAGRLADPMDFEMYNFGHLMSAACVHHRATGKTSLLAVARKAADFLDEYFRTPTVGIARHGICPSHLMGLVQLYRVSGEKRYLDLAVRLLNMRDLVEYGDDDNQDRIAFRKQRTAVGHAVRATYLYAGAADIFAHTGDESLMESLTAIWDDLVSRKLYITGGCGALFDGASPDGAIDQTTIMRVHQSFGRNYQLPQTTAHNETCAAIGNVMWNWRMLLITGDARFADVIEQTLLNSVLAGVSLDGTSFFYTNTLRQVKPQPSELRWNRRRETFTGCFCCPPNVARTLAESHTWAYARSNKDVWVVLYGGNAMEVELESGRLKLSQETDYPWDGKVRIAVEEAPATGMAIHVRIPGWAKKATVHVNGQAISPAAEAGTFVALPRQWKRGDLIELDFPMPARLVEAHPYVEEARNQAAVLRGPVVYCLESVDLPEGVGMLDVYLTSDAAFETEVDQRLGGVSVLKTRGLAVASEKWSGGLYRDLAGRSARPVDLRLIPYFAWDNRGESEMTVWLPLMQ